MNVASGAISAIPMITEIYERWRDWVKKDDGRKAQNIVDGVPPDAPDVNYNTPPQTSIEEIKQRPVMPHCKRHFYTDTDGQTKSVLVC